MSISVDTGVREAIFRQLSEQQSEMIRSIAEAPFRRIAEQQSEMIRSIAEAPFRRIAEQQSEMIRSIAEAPLRRIAEQQSEMIQSITEAPFRRITEQLAASSIGIERIVELHKDALSSWNKSLLRDLLDIHTRLKPIYEEIQNVEAEKRVSWEKEESTLLVPQLEKDQLENWRYRIGILLITLDSFPPDLTSYGLLKLLLLTILIDLEIQRELTERSLL